DGMTRLLPRSLLGQVMLALAAALLIAQAISAVMLYRAASERREFALASAASFQLLAGQRRDLRVERRASGPPRPVTRRIPGAERGLRLPRRIRFTETAAVPLLPGESRNPAREATITQQLERQGLAVAEVVATERAVSADPLIAQSAADSPEWRERLPANRETLLVVGLR
ncbi:MAG TPA: two-component sensor histidine kinase, partial [Erythrobacter sp.]|nr:two-component sensor histidine kinase [Erythrobacter sp.]